MGLFIFIQGTGPRTVGACKKPTHDWRLERSHRDGGEQPAHPVSKGAHNEAGTADLLRQQNDAWD